MRWTALFLCLALCGNASCAAVRKSSNPLPTSSYGTTYTCIKLQTTGILNCSLGQEFTDNSTLAIAEAVSKSCNCNFSILNSKLLCINETSALLQGSIPSNQVDVFMTWLQSTNGTAGFDTFPASTINGTNCQMITTKASIVDSLWFKVSIGGGGGLVLMCLYNAVLLFIKIKRQQVKRRRDECNITVPLISEYAAAVSNPTTTDGSKSCIPTAKMREVADMSTDNDRHSCITMETSVSCNNSQYSSLKTLCKMNEAVLSESVADKSFHASGLIATAQHEKKNELVLNPSTDHCNVPNSIAIADPMACSNPMQASEDDASSKSPSSNTSEPSVLMPKKGHGHKKSVSFAEFDEILDNHVISPTNESVGQITVAEDSAVNKNVAVEQQINAQLVTKLPSKGNILDRWSFANCSEKESIKSSAVESSTSMAASDKLSDGTGGVLPRRGLVADIARKWNATMSDGQKSNNSTPGAKAVSDQEAVNQLKPATKNDTSRRPSFQSMQTNCLINSANSSHQNDSFGDGGAVPSRLIEKEDSKFLATSSQQDSVNLSHDLKRGSMTGQSEPPSLPANGISLLEEQNPFAYNLESLLNIPISSRDRSMNATNSTQQSAPVIENFSSHVNNASTTNTFVPSADLETTADSIEDSVTPFVLEFPLIALPVSSTDDSPNNGGITDEESNAHHFSPRASGVGSISHKWFFPTSFSSNDPFTAFQQAATALRNKK